ncbi:hypothetical protein H2201_002623 [Coniosporium apollinis]|uniref:Pentacotripeptide-repeat region of PRORP domain-containing protein n=1 Tax=Coniosporium apollinis TaxID=61459 RepID=A0ABQ9NXJ1_9PEZI|nr:hypothetical protein H2201_002623 [Coniosporium apollinis]
MDKPIVGRYSRGLQPSIRSEDSLPLAVPPARTEATRPQSEVTGRATRLEELLDDPKHTTREAWQFFLKYFDTQKELKASRLAFQDLGKLLRGSTFQKLLKAIVEEWHQQNESATLLPSPSVLIAKYQELKIMRPELWSNAIWLVLAQAAAGSVQTHEATTAQRSEALFAELVALWKAFFAAFARPKSNESTDSEGPPNAWLGLPDIRGWTRRLSGSNQSRNFGERLVRFAPRFGTAAMGSPDLQAAAFLTFNLLGQSDGSGATTALTEADHEHFVRFIAYLLPGVRVDPLLSRIRFQLQSAHLPMERIDELLSQCKAFESRAMVIIGLNQDESSSTAEGASNAPPGDAQDRLENFFIKRLERAIETQSVRQVETIWQDVQQAFARPRDGVPMTVIPTRVYGTFLRVYMHLRQPNKAVDVWNTMIANGVQPTVATWTAMMDGASKAKDFVATEQIWHRMLASGVSPDAHAWTVRIQSLMLSGHHTRGLQILDEMGRIYADAARKRQVKREGNISMSRDPPDVAKPNIETVNSMITALMRTRKQDLIPNVLAWARAFGIQPDAVTFNILIRAALQNDNAQEAMRLLKQMETMNVQPDVATVTIILNHVFRASALSDMPQQQQQEVVISTLQQLQTHGLPENAWVYSTLIDSLLKHHENLPAARAVLDYMSQRRITPSAHIYTMLITHYFSQSPPDVAAVDALWSHIEATSGVTDLIFFDRLVEGYARAGEAGRMMTFLARMGRERKSPSWFTLTTVVRALADVGDMARIRTVVNDVRNGKDPLRDRLRDARARNEFWGLVESLGIGDSDGQGQAESSLGAWGGGSEF